MRTLRHCTTGKRSLTLAHASIERSLRRVALCAARRIPLHRWPVSVRLASRFPLLRTRLSRAPLPGAARPPKARERGKNRNLDTAAGWQQAFLEPCLLPAMRARLADRLQRQVRAYVPYRSSDPPRRVQARPAPVPADATAWVTHNCLLQPPVRVPRDNPAKRPSSLPGRAPPLRAHAPARRAAAFQAPGESPADLAHAPPLRPAHVSASREGTRQGFYLHSSP